MSVEPVVGPFGEGSAVGAERLPRVGLRARHSSLTRKMRRFLRSGIKTDARMLVLAKRYIPGIEALRCDKQVAYSAH